MLYIRPASAIGRILDHGRLWFGILAALAVSMFVRAGLEALPLRLPLIQDVIATWIGYSTLAPLLAVALAFAPAVIVLRGAAGFGGFGVLMQRDYSSLLLCLFTAWAAAYLPFAILGWLLPFGPILLLAANIYFAILAAFAIRTVFGTGFAAALGLSLVGCIAAMGGIALSDLAGGLKYYVLSPFLLYYAYSAFGSDVRSLGEGLRGRQQFQRQMEIATTNPRDADAHYQLGLIYQKRRQYTEAIARFQKAVEIDPTEVDAQLQLGRIARDQGRFDDAIRSLTAAAAIDDKLSSSQVWRELGASYFGGSRFDDAAAALAKYTQRHPYDPEGQYWYGRTLAALGRKAEAQAAFDQCIEAVDTMPKHRRAEIRKWKGLAKTELSAL